jgi:predicted Rossmann fold nucleotide-binding protein DprA/Smf involved in DNA uptake
MKCVICGSREVTSYEVVKQAIKESGFEITEVVSGTARGVDRLGEKWAEENNIPITRMPANWDLHGKSAGYIRNKDMVLYVGSEGCVIAVWNGSSGTQHTINLAKEHNVKLFVKRV